MAVAHKGSISMDLVLTPIGMYKTSQDNVIHFNQPDKFSLVIAKYRGDMLPTKMSQLGSTVEITPEVLRQVADTCKWEESF